MKLVSRSCASVFQYLQDLFIRGLVKHIVIPAHRIELGIYEQRHYVIRHSPEPFHGIR